MVYWKLYIYNIKAKLGTYIIYIIYYIGICNFVFMQFRIQTFVFSSHVRQNSIPTRALYTNHVLNLEGHGKIRIILPRQLIHF